jgi:hypothetical protein
MSFSIPFNRPCLLGNEYKYIAEAIANGHASGDGPFTRLCQKFLETELQVPRVLLTTSCTDALEMAAILLNCGPEDEVILPSFTFVSTANAFVLRGARLVFADVRPDTMNLDESQIESLITSRTKAIVPVHYAGVSCEWGHARLCSLYLTPVQDLVRQSTPKWNERVRATTLDPETVSSKLQPLFNQGDYNLLLPFLERHWKEILRDPCTRTNAALVRPSTLDFFREFRQ